MTPFRWRIELFGSLCLLREDQVVETFPPSKVGGLLAYLACQSERTHTRQELAAFFWPEADNGTGRTRLRQHLTALRRQLEPEGIPPNSVLRTKTWIDRYEPNPGNDKDSQASNIAVNKEGSIYVIGFIDTVKTGVDFITLKYAPNGEQCWEARYNGTGNDMDRAGYIAVDDEGNVYVTGESMGKSGSGPDKINELDIVTLKYDANGNKIGEDRYDGPGNGRDSPTALALDNKGHLYVFGSAWGGKSENGKDGHGCVLIQYDRNPHDGKLKRNWIRPYYDPNGRPAYGSAMALDPAGMVYVTGRSGNGFVTLIYDTDGKIIGKNYCAMPLNTASQPLHILRDNEGNLYVVSQVLIGTQQIGQESFALQVVKYNKKLSLQWNKTYREIEYWVEGHRIVTQNIRVTDAMVDGRVYITGTTKEATIGSPWVQSLIVIREAGNQFGIKTFSGAPYSNQCAHRLTIDHHRLIHVTGQAHFADTEVISSLLDSTEITTNTYDCNASLLCVRRYAGSPFLHSLGGLAIATDKDDNIIVAGQTFDGKTNDLVLLKYPP